MPLLKLETSVPLTDDKRTNLAQALSTIVAETIGKPESYMMVIIGQGTVCMGGEVSPGAFVDIRSIGGLNPSVNGTLSEKVCGLLGEELGIDTRRVYLNFSNVERPGWGWDGKTF